MTLLLVIVLFSALYLRGPNKRSPRELLLTIASTGYEVEKGEAIKEAVQEAEFAFWIEIDGHRVAAYRFGSRDRARDVADAFQKGFAVGYWAFDHVDSQTRAKLATALK